MKRIVTAALGALVAVALASPSHATLNTCAAAKKLCVAKKVAGLLKCHAKNEKPPGIDPAKFAACVLKAQDKFDGGNDPSKGCFAKLEAKFGPDCLTSSDTTTLEATVDAFVTDVVCQLDPGGGTCPLPTTTPTPTPTATPIPPTCTDGMQNGSETDVDCGGTCPACGLGGACAMGTDCVASTTCAGNSCVCAAGRSDCNGSPADACEVTPATDVGNCGSCNNACSTINGTSACVASQCTIASCNAGFANCNGALADGCERNTTADLNNCGSCGHVCAAVNGTPSCVASQCQIACNSGFKNCDNLTANGCEINSNTDPNNCGLCGNTCLAGHRCIAGVCS